MNTLAAYRRDLEDFRAETGGVANASADVTRRLQAQQAAAQQQQAAETGANADYLKYLGLQ